MGHTINYSGKPARRAILNALNYMERKRFKIVVRVMKGGHSFPQCLFVASFAGVSGYPVEVMLKRYHPRYIRRFGKITLTK